MEWYQQYKKIVAFGKILYRAGKIAGAVEVLGYFDDPKVWTDAWEIWDELGSPDRGEDGWTEFVERVEVSEDDVEFEDDEDDGIDPDKT